MANEGKQEVVAFMQLKPGLAKFKDAQEQIANLLASFYRLFGPVNPEAEYIAITGTNNGDLWVWIIELTPPAKEEEPEGSFTEEDLENFLEKKGGKS